MSPITLVVELTKIEVELAEEIEKMKSMHDEAPTTIRGFEESNNESSHTQIMINLIAREYQRGNTSQMSELRRHVKRMEEELHRVKHLLGLDL